MAAQALTPLDMNMPRLYGTRWVLCFALANASDKVEIFSRLREGLAHTVIQIPWIAGVIEQQEGSCPNDSRIQIGDPDEDRGLHFSYNDLSGPGRFPSFEQLRKNKFPLSEFATALLSPVGVMPTGSKFPAMAAQANFVNGGLLLAVAAHHSTCDAIGFNTIITTWASVTRSIGTSQIFWPLSKTANDRTPLMAGPAGASIDDFPEYTIAPTPPTTPSTSSDVNSHQMATSPSQLPPMTSKIFYFSPSSLDALKTVAAAFSTNDALNALVWRHVTLARLKRTAGAINGHNSTALLYSVNVRPHTYPPLPQDYTGNAAVAGITRHLTAAEMSQHSSSALPLAAAAIRTSLARLIADNPPNRVGLTIGLISSRANPTDLKFAYNGFLGPDLSSTSWADLRLYDLDWGQGLGGIEAFRVPVEGADGAMIVLPRMKDGGLEVVVALEEKAMGKLVGDEEFGRFAELRS